jgi:hypothetical protein
MTKPGHAMRLSLVLASLAALAACAPPAPYEQVGGVGFGSPDEYQARREAELASGSRQIGALGSPFPAAGAGAPVTTLPGGVRPLPPEIYAAVDAAESGTAPAAGTSGTVAADPQIANSSLPLGQTVTSEMTNLPAVDPNNAGISDEQEFSAVSSRETIETDKARIEANKAQYQQVAPTELPQRTGTAASPIIEYAINAQNRLGQSVYSRSSIALASHDKACARYDSPAKAQEAFLGSGGPKRDPKNLDPDGDGFACRWDPTPFQKARG